MLPFAPTPSWRSPSCSSGSSWRWSRRSISCKCAAVSSACANR